MSLADVRLPRHQDATCGQGVNPVESDAARVALVEAYKALCVLNEGGYLAYIAEALHDHKAAEQAGEAKAQLGRCVCGGSMHGLLTDRLEAEEGEVGERVRAVLADDLGGFSRPAHAAILVGRQRSGE